jgi:tetratricopeptide (TPR) repeat protein
MKKAFFIFFILILIALIYITQKEVDLHRKALRQTEELTYIPSGKYLKTAVLGYDQIAADFFWLRVVQYIGDKEKEAQGYPLIYQLIDLVTNLDPKFSYAYKLGGIILSVYTERIKESNALLDKGVKENPEVWDLPFFLGFNYFFYLSDYYTAAEYIKKASQIPGHPRYLPKLVARLYAQAGSPEVALEFLYRASEQAPNEKIREELKERMKEVIIERDIIFLEKAVKIYQEKYRRLPDSLKDLVREKIIQGLPPEPFDGYYYLDPKSKEIKSSTHPERLRIYK